MTFLKTVNKNICNVTLIDVISKVITSKFVKSPVVINNVVICKVDMSLLKRSSTVS
jgi:hypothetical protein